MKSLEPELVILPDRLVITMVTKATVLTSTNFLTLHSGQAWPSKFLPIVLFVILIIIINTEIMNPNSKGINKNCGSWAYYVVTVEGSW